MPTQTEKMICVTCPKGCTLDVTHDGKTVLKVDSGCKRGQAYVQQELTDPRRMVASSVRIRGSLHPLLPVYTSEPFPKPRIPELLALLRKVEVEAPILLDQTVLEDVLGTGISIRASRKIENQKLSSEQAQ
jgi:CxxC motif-containing protein